jgi:hypothetical protein
VDNSVDDSVNSSTTVSGQLLNGSSTDLASLGPIHVFSPFPGGWGMLAAYLGLFLARPYNLRVVQYTLKGTAP